MFELVAHEKLKNSIKESIRSLILHHKPDHKVDLDNLKDAVMVLPVERCIQCLVLLKILELTSVMNATTESEITLQARTLNAAVYYIRTKIEETYKYSSSGKSSFYNLLNTSLELRKDNQPTQNELVSMYTVLEQFLLKSVYKESDPSKGYLDVQAFAISGYSVTKDIMDLADKILVMRKAIIIDAEKLYLEAKRPMEKSSGFLGLFGLAASSSSIMSSDSSGSLTL